MPLFWQFNDTSKNTWYSKSVKIISFAWSEKKMQLKTCQVTPKRNFKSLTSYSGNVFRYYSIVFGVVDIIFCCYSIVFGNCFTTLCDRLWLFNIHFVIMASFWALRSHFQVLLHHFRMFSYHLRPFSHLMTLSDEHKVSSLAWC